MPEIAPGDFMAAPTGFANKPALKGADNLEEITVEQAFSEVFSPLLTPNFTRLQTILLLPHIFSQLCLPVAPALMRLWLYGELPTVPSKPGVRFELIRNQSREGGNNRLYLKTQLELFDSPLFTRVVTRAENASQEALNGYFANSALLRTVFLPGLRRQRAWPSEREWLAARQGASFHIGDFNQIEVPQIRVHSESEGDLFEQVRAFTGLSPELDLMASLGRFNIYVYFDGEVVKQDDHRGTVRIRRRGLRLYDSFDFVDAGSIFSQILGIWSGSVGGCGQVPRFINLILLLIREQLMPGVVLSELLTNADFRSFREEVMNRVNSRLEDHAQDRRLRVTPRRLKCQDFIIFTDMRITTIDPPREFQVEL